MLIPLRKIVSCLPALLLFALLHAAQATPLLTLTMPDSVAGAPGASITVTGDIINRTNADLASTDLFLDFSHFDPGQLSPLQVLGLASFDIPSFSFMHDVALFTIDIAPASMPGPQTLDILLQDVNGNFSGLATLTVQVQPAGTVPEPPTLALVLAGACAFIRHCRPQIRKGERHGNQA